jgi:hypothetical protein
MSAPIVFRDLERYRIPVVGTALCVLGVLSAICIIAYQHRLSVEESSLEAKLRKLEQRQISAQPFIENLPATTPEQMRRVLRKMNFPWEGFFLALEAATTTDATLLSITTDAEHGEVVLRGGAKDLFAALDYMGTLAEQKRFFDVKLVEHETDARNPMLPLIFVIQARWNTEAEPM